VKPPPAPLLVWDGDCAFCRAWIARWRRATGDRVHYATYQEVAARFPEIPVERFRRAVHLIEPDGRVSSGAEAVYGSLALAPRGGWALALYRGFPPFAWASEAAYRRIADHRPAFTRLTGWIWGEHVVPPGERLTAWITSRLLGLVYVVAFVSLWSQLDALAGSRGILPASEFLAAARAQFGPERYLYFPTLCWLGSSDRFLHLSTVGQDFLWFQWDSLLLEAGVLALLLAPWRLWSRPASDPPPSRAGLWLTRWLLFRLMFSSAVVKLSSGDPSWRHLTALEFHYETQCLPPWTAWYAHHLPAAFQRFSALAMFAIEGIVPFFIVAPRRIRFAAAAALASLQALIVVTGNYGFFNWLALALCVPLLDDGVWPRRLRERLGGQQAGADAAAAASPAHGVRGAWPRPVTTVAAVALVALSVVPMARIFRRPAPWLAPLEALTRMVGELHLVNSYGLFAVMTTTRDEIVVEGSDDLTHWQAYEFEYKPGDPLRRPRFVAPHQPRIDWQMWFAALSDYRQERWFVLFCRRLLEGSPPVLAQLAVNPFPRAPPRYVRALVYRYHFTDAATRRRTGAWWRREYRGPYCPVLTLEGGQLRGLAGSGP